MAMVHLLKIRTSIDIFKNEKCKVTFGLEYTSDTEAPFLDLHLSISIDFDKRDDFDFFYISNFHFLDSDVPRRPYYGAYLSQLIRLTRVGVT